MGAAISTIVLKVAAYWITDSIGLLSDAFESLVNLAAAVLALLMLQLAQRPPDEDHPYGHNKAEYFASGAEGALIVFAAVSIGWAAIGRFSDPHPPEQLGLGILFSLLATIINAIVATVLLRAGRAYRSIILEADAHHLFSDVWTTAGVLVGLLLTAITRWYWLDPLLALCVAGNIIWAGGKLMSRSVLGLMDTALSSADMQAIYTTLQPHREKGIQFHAVRTRQAGMRKFLSFHVLVPGEWSVLRGHQLLELIETELRQTIPDLHVFTHLEPLDDPSAWDDEQLDR